MISTIVVILALIMVVTPVMAQEGETTTVAKPSEKLTLGTAFRGFGQFGMLHFAAADSFNAVTGSSRGFLWGGGAQVNFSNGLFFQGGYERYQSTGQRVFVVEDEIFELDIENKVTVTPIQITVGYRRPITYRIVSYIGVGIGQHRLKEVAELSELEENTNESKLGYHLLGGVEFALTRWLRAGGEGQWSSASNAFGDDGVSKIFDEDNLGGFTLRFRLIFGI